MGYRMFDGGFASIGSLGDDHTAWRGRGGAGTRSPLNVEPSHEGNRVAEMTAAPGSELQENCFEVLRMLPDRQPQAGQAYCFWSSRPPGPDATVNVPCTNSTHS